jgi:DNA-binding transcriptional ArsR family regulator
MVKYQDATDAALDRTFAALSDPTRRALVARLAGGEAVSISQLAQPFDMSLPAVMKHLDVLSDAGLVTRSKNGRIVRCQFAPSPMEDAMNWLDRYLRFWNAQLDRLAAFVEKDSWSPQPKASSKSQASPSNVVSMRRRKKSTPRGPTQPKS